MARGRRAKPTAEKKRDGNPGKRPLNKKEPEYALGVPDPPAAVADDEVALAEWMRIVPILLNSKVLTQGDLATVVGYCTQYSLYNKAKAEVDEHGITILGPMGKKKNPAVTVLQDAGKQMRAFATELGLTPAARTKVSTVDDPHGQGKEKTKKFFGPYAQKLASTLTH